MYVMLGGRSSKFCRAAEGLRAVAHSLLLSGPGILLSIWTRLSACSAEHAWAESERAPKVSLKMPRLNHCGQVEDVKFTLSSESSCGQPCHVCIRQDRLKGLWTAEKRRGWCRGTQLPGTPSQNDLMGRLQRHLTAALMALNHWHLMAPVAMSSHSARCCWSRNSHGRVWKWCPELVIFGKRIHWIWGYPMLRTHLLRLLRKRFWFWWPQVDFHKAWSRNPRVASIHLWFNSLGDASQP